MTEIFELIDANDAQGVLALLARVPEQAAARDEEDLTAVRRAAYRSPELLDAVTSANPPLDGFDAATSRGSPTRRRGRRTVSHRFTWRRAGVRPRRCGSCSSGVPIRTS